MPDIDHAYGAFQRGYYLTAFALATQRVEKGDAKAMTLLGELHANGLGVPRDDRKAADWYKLAVERGDREAMFALALFRLSGRAGPRDREEAAKLLAAAAKLGHAAAAYNLGLLYLEGQQFPQDFGRAAELFRLAAQAGTPEAQYALATLLKDGRGVTKDLREAARLLAAASLADNTDAQVEYAIALFNGEGIARDESAAAAPPAQGCAQGQPDRAEPARPHPCHRPRPSRRSGGSDEMAPHRQGTRSERSVARRIRRQASRRRARCRRAGGEALADDAPATLLTCLLTTGRPPDRHAPRKRGIQ